MVVYPEIKIYAHFTSSSNKSEREWSSQIIIIMRVDMRTL